MPRGPFTHVCAEVETAFRPYRPGIDPPTMGRVVSRDPSPWERMTKLAQAQGRVSVQADCTVAEALVLMQQRAEETRHTLDEIADAVGQHRMWFS